MSQVTRPTPTKLTSLTSTLCASKMNTACIQGAAMNDEVGFRIRVDETLRREFIALCKLQDTTGAQILRAFMRSYVEQHGSAVRQPELFSARNAGRNT